MRLEEQSIQKAVVMYLRLKHPEVIFTSAPAVAKNPRQGAINKAMGYLKGFPDLCLFEPRRKLHGLFIELKSRSGSTHGEQTNVHDALRVRGYAVVVCRSYDEATEVIEAYLKK
jgi:hypothetical protein